MNEDVDWVLLSRYAAGDCTDDERVEIGQRLAHVPQYRLGLDALQRVVAQSRLTMSADERAQRLARLRERVLAADTRRLSAAHVRAAAIVLLVFSGALAGYLHLRHQRMASEPIDGRGFGMTTSRDEWQATRLADGTVVLLGPSSALRLSTAYERGDRTVRLDGEAEFVVAHQAQWPFTVRAKHLVARDLGTRFLVRAYAGEPTADIVVTEGAIHLMREPVANLRGDGDGVVLGRGQRARVTAGGHVAVVSGGGLDCCRMRFGEHLAFHKVPLREALSQIGRWRGVVIDLAVPPKLGMAPFVGVFHDTIPTTAIIRKIALMYGLETTQLGSDRYLVRTP